jgi:hypothetical protein
MGEEFQVSEWEFDHMTGRLSFQVMPGLTLKYGDHLMPPSKSPPATRGCDYLTRAGAKFYIARLGTWSVCPSAS